MTTPAVTIADIVGRLTDRSRPGRTEATIQSDVRMLLLAAGLNIVDGDLRDIVLESPVGERRRIDVELGACVIEIKRDLRHGRPAAVDQLRDYVAERTRVLGQRYVGILTDGLVWRLYHLDSGALTDVSSHTVGGDSAAPDRLVEWLAGVLATEELVAPTPAEILARLGAASSGHALEYADLRAIYAANRQNPEVAIKRDLWAKLLTTALGTQFSADDDDLFVEHTFLVVIAECVAHAALGFDLKQVTPASLVGGELFSRDAQIFGVVEHDFFDWPLECGNDGVRWIGAVARRLAQFSWGNVRHDVMKTIYESVISPTVRKHLGEYYTPDFLAELMVATTVDDPLQQRVLDPSCGSGTFLFHAVRRYLEHATAAGLSEADAVTGVVNHVFGLDVHPVATTLARVTYLLAIGTDRLRSEDRPPLRIPVFLGDSLQWGQRDSLFTSETLTVATQDGAQLFADELRFPSRLLADAAEFDRLVSDVAAHATSRAPGSRWQPFEPVARRHPLAPSDLAVVEATYEALCRLHDTHQNHIWSYFVRNLARPAWLAQEANRVDVLLGNPPWLAFRFMTDAMQRTFRQMSEARRLWTGGSVATQQDLSDLFVARAVEQYLRLGGRFSFVMPAGVLSRNQYSGFRTGNWASPENETHAELDTPWDLSAVTPYFFPRTSAVVHGIRSRTPRAATNAIDRWSGNIRKVSASWATVEQDIVRTTSTRALASELPESPYRQRFANGATIFPRVLTVVTRQPGSPIGAGAGRAAVRSHRGKYENPPWKQLDDLDGVVERQFLTPLLLGETVLPFRQQPALTAVLPLRHGRLIDADLDAYPGLDDWWTRAEALWTRHRKSKLGLADNLNYRRKLVEQFPLAPQRVVYTASGMHVAACRVTDSEAVVEHQLYWSAVQRDDEGLYLCAVLNSAAVTRAVEPLMVSGKGGGRHIDTYLWRVPIPTFDPNDPLHLDLVELGRRGEQLVSGLELVAADHGILRRRIRQAIRDDGLGTLLDTAVDVLLTNQAP